MKTTLLRTEKEKTLGNDEKKNTLWNGFFVYNTNEHVFGNELFIDLIYSNLTSHWMCKTNIEKGIKCSNYSNAFLPILDINPIELYVM
jgi:hypothetical protein